jgi:hypothetical protein
VNEHPPENDECESDNNLYGGSWRLPVRRGPFLHCEGKACKNGNSDADTGQNRDSLVREVRHERQNQADKANSDKDRADHWVASNLLR